MNPIAERPLLTIAIPTYNRAPFLKELLEVLAPQLRTVPEIELLISNNCSPDETEDVVNTFRDQIPRLNYVRNSENIGSDNNFIQCFHLATGKFFFLLGDDDILLPGAIHKIKSLLQHQDPDILYLSTTPFTTDFQSHVRPDPLNRGYRVFSDAQQFAKLVNIMFTFISCIVVNKDRLSAIGAPPIELARGSALIQLSWVLPLLRHHRTSICIFERILAGRVNNGGYFNIATVLGINLHRESIRLLSAKSPIAQCLVSATFRRWFPGELMNLRRSANREELAKVRSVLETQYCGNRDYIWFVAPFFWLPLPIAETWLKSIRVMNKLLYVVNIPNFWSSQKVVSTSDI